MSDHISSLRLSVQGPFQSQLASPGLDSLVQGDSVVFRELQFRHTGPSYIFSESTPFQQFILDIRYGPYKGWVPCSASGEI